MNLKFKRIIGNIAKVFSPGYSTCYHCGRPWTICKGHTTFYNESSGAFPLCESCWKELSIEERWKYYELLVFDWGGDDKLFREMKKAVFDGK